MKAHPDLLVRIAAIILVLAAWAAVIALAGASSPAATVRYAWDCDGNQHDEDDIGALAMALALFDAADMNLVHVSYSNHIGSSTGSWEARMTQTATGGLAIFGFPQSIAFDVQADEKAAIDALVAEINVSSQNRRLVIFEAGPWEHMARVLESAQPSKHQFIDFITHSDWNDGHRHFSSHRNRYDIEAWYAPGGQYSNQVAPTFTRIPDQNPPAWNSSFSGGAWDWMDGDPERPNLQFVYDRTADAGAARGDMSDAGMAAYAIDGEKDADMDKVKSYFGL